jgi:hypothetical protein
MRHKVNLKERYTKLHLPVAGHWQAFGVRHGQVRSGHVWYSAELEVQDHDSPAKKMLQSQQNLNEGAHCGSWQFH